MRVCIFGLPKTGTTGVYGLIKNGMRDAGLEPVSAFEPSNNTMFKSFFDKSHPDVSFMTKVMIRKTYFEEPEVINQFSHKIMIVRDPRDRAISRLLFRAVANKRFDDEASLNEFIELLRKKEKDPKSISFVKLTREADRLGIGKSEWATIENRMKFQIRKMQQHGFHRLYYEDFVNKNFSELNEYLGLELAGNQAKNASWLGHISRSKSSGEWKNWFIDEDVEFIRPMFKPYMDHFDYEDDWEIPAQQEIASKNASEYVVNRYAKRKKEFSLMDNEVGGNIKNKTDLQFFEGRAEDGRNQDIYRVATYYFDKKENQKAFYWFEIGHLLGNIKCTKALRKIIKKGYRPEAHKSKFVAELLR